MKVLLALHGYPPELRGGTENAVQSLARGLARRGHEVIVVAGSMEWEAGFRVTESSDVDESEGAGATIRVYRIHRDDLYFDHWHKSASPRAARAFREIVERERPDLVHVHHWIRTSRDLVAQAARAGVPAVVTLHDLWTTCLISFRVRPDTRRFCEAPLAADPCLACAGALPPRTPWVAPEEGWKMIAEQRSAVVRELTLARAVAVPTRAHAVAVERFLRLEEPLALRIVPPAHEMDLTPRDAPIEDGKLRLGAWGHLSQLKGPDLILGAVDRARHSERIELHFAGGEPEADFAQRLRERAEASRASVEFHGPYQPRDLQHHPVTDVHAMVSGSRAHESWGLVLDEALALGIPAILPRRGAFEERASAGDWGLLFEPEEEVALAEVLDGLVEDLDSGGSQLAVMRASAASAHAASLTEAEQLDAWVSVYTEVVATGPPAPPADDWWEERMGTAFEENWDRELQSRDGIELGFEA